MTILKQNVTVSSTSNQRIRNSSYHAQISSERDRKDSRFYIGICKPSFKSRIGNHLKSFNNVEYSKDTTLSKHFWFSKRAGKAPLVTWSIAKKSNVCKQLHARCGICINEKLKILGFANPEKLLNVRSDLSTKCIHRYRLTLAYLK